MEEYNYEWLHDNLLHVRMSKSVFPTFWTSDEDPKEITDLKEKLYDIKNSMEKLESQIYRMMKKEKNE